MTAAELEQIRIELAAAPKRLRALVEGIGAAALTMRTAAGEFSILENAWHLRDIEVDGYLLRIERLLREDDPILADLDGEALAALRRYNEQPLGPALKDFAQARQASVDRLSGIAEDQLARTARLGDEPITLGRLLQVMLDHDRGHLDSIAALRSLVAGDRPVDRAVAYFERNRDRYVTDLAALCRIPGVSSRAFDAGEVRRSAGAVEELLGRYGLRNVQLLEVEGAHPAVYGERVEHEGLPTVLVYAHHDVQPPGELSRWTTPPFEPEERGGRLFGRGTSDDKGGLMAHLAAIDAWLSTAGSLPCNVKCFIEGEEEIGSPNLAAFLERYGELLRADVVVLADTPNLDTGVPALTYRLRGMCQIDVEVRCLERPLHSGRGSGVVPDPVAILCRLIASLQREDGVIVSEEIARGVETLSSEERERFARLQIGADRFRNEAGVLDGVQLLGGSGESILERLWARPSLTVIAFEARPVAGSINQILDSARARLSIRTVPSLDSRETGQRIAARLMKDPPANARVDARVVAAAPWWRTEPSGPAFEAALRALARGYGRQAELIGSGGSIAFVRRFEDAFPGVPLLLMGVEDPPCNAHSEDESLHLGDWASCTRSAIYFYDELTAGA